VKVFRSAHEADYTLAANHLMSIKESFQYDATWNLGEHEVIIVFTNIGAKALETLGFIDLKAFDDEFGDNL
jgi:hypothetical protein